MSIQQLGVILEDSHHCKISEQPYGRLLEYRWRSESDWQQIEIEAWVWGILEKQYEQVIEKWSVGDE